MTTALPGYDLWLQSGSPYDAELATCVCGHDEDEHDVLTMTDEDGDPLTIVRCSDKNCRCNEFEARVYDGYENPWLD